MGERGVRSSSELNKFEQVSSDGHKMSVVGGRGRSPGLMLEEVGLQV